MKIPTSVSRISWLALLACPLIPLATYAAESTTDPVGAMVKTLKGASDTTLALPLNKAAEYRGLAASAAATTVTVQGSPAWTTDQWANAYYLYVKAGTDSGMALKITANTADTVTVETNATDTTTNIANGTSLAIVKYWTPATLFAGVTLEAGTEIQDFSTAGAGTDLAPQKWMTYNGATWDDQDFNPADDAPLMPGTSYQVRLPDGSSDVSLVLAGDVPMAKSRVVLAGIDDGVDQDIRVSFVSPVPATIGDVDPATLNVGDTFFVMPDADAGINKSSTYWVTWNGAGWDDSDFNDVTATFQFQPGVGYVFRKVGTTPATTVVWQNNPPYIP